MSRFEDAPCPFGRNIRSGEAEIELRDHKCDSASLGPMTTISRRSTLAKSLLEGLDQMLMVSSLCLPIELRRSLTCTNIIENLTSTVRRISRNAKRWRSASMALHWTVAAMQEASKGFRRLKAYKRSPVLRAAPASRYSKPSNNRAPGRKAQTA